MAGTQNRYIVTWDMHVNSQQATAGLNAYATALNNAARAMRSYNTQLARAKKNGMVMGGGAVGGAGRAAGSSAAAAGAVAMGASSTQMPRSGTIKGGGKTARPSRSWGRGAMAGAAASRYQSPLKGTPFGGLMGTLLAFSAVSSQAKQAAEYSNIIETSKAILKISDDDLSTFEERFGRLSDNVRQIGLDTKYTAVEVAGATRFLAMAGLDMKSIDASMRPIADLATIGDEDISTIADLTTNIMTGYGIDATRMRDVADIITSTMSRANVSIIEIAESYKMASGYLSAAGVDFSEATAAIGVLGDAGMKATLAGTALRSMIIRFAKPSKQAKQMLDELGVSFTRTIGEGANQAVKLKPLAEIFQELGDKGATLEQLQTIFGMIGGNAALQLTNRVEKLSELTAQNAIAHGLSIDTSMKKQETVMGRWAQFVSAIQETLLKSYLMSETHISGALREMTETILSEDFTEGLSKMIVGITQMLEMATKFGAWVAQNWGWIQPLVVGKFLFSNILNLGRGLAQAGGYAKGLLGSISGMGASATRAGAAFGGWGIAAAAVGSAITAMYIDMKMLEKANQRAYDSIMEGAPDIYSSFEELGKILKANNSELGDSKKHIEDISATKITGIDSQPSFLRSMLINLGRGVLMDAGASDELVDEADREMSQATYKQQEAFATQELKKAYDDVTNKFLSAIGRSDIVDFVNLSKPHWMEPHMLKTRYEIDDSLYYPSGVIKTGVGDGSDEGVKAFYKTYEFQDKFKSGMDSLSSTLDIWSKAVSESDSAAKLISSMISDDNMRKLSSLGVSISSSGFNIPARLKDESQAQYDASQSAIGQIIRDTIRGSKNAVPVEVSRAALEKLGVSGEMWKLGGVNTGGVDINELSKLGTDDEGASGSGGGTHTRGLSASRTQTRQVIIDIDNLLNIDNVEINNQNGEVQIESIKEHIAQALLDVVHDASVSYL